MFSRPSSTLLLGYHGNRNFGDDLFADVIFSQIRERDPAHRFYIPADASGAFAKRTNVRVIATKMLPGLTRFRWMRARKAITHILLGGGNLLESAKYAQSIIDDLASPWAKNVYRAAIGLGVDTNFRSISEDKLAECLEQFDFVGFRDSTSYDWAMSRSFTRPRIVEAEDLAFLADVPHVASKPDAPIGVSLCDWRQIAAYSPGVDSRERLFRLVNQVYVAAKAVNRKVRFLGLCANAQQNDVEAIREIGRGSLIESDCEFFSYTGDTSQLIRAMNDCCSIVAMRLHAAVIATRLHKPLLMLSYHAKCKAFANQISLHHDCLLDIQGVVDHEVATTTVNRFLSSLEPAYGNCAVHDRNAEKNFKFLDRMP